MVLFVKFSGASEGRSLESLGCSVEPMEVWERNTAEDDQRRFETAVSLDQ